MSAGASEADFLLPLGTITLLLADLEGSVRLWESDLERMKTAMALQDELVTEAIARHSGVRPREQGEGDSFLAAFSRASDAIECALEIQLALSEQDWASHLRLRMGLHTGEVQRRDEGNYVGASVNRCARLRDAGHGGQTILSQSTYDLVLDRLPKAVWIDDLGTHRLRDLARPEHLYQLCHPDLPETFPPLRTLDALPNNLPVQLSSFVGRANEIMEVAQLLHESRLLTLTGSGGCGKTRLALQVAADVLDRYPEGVWWVDLAGLTDPALVPSAAASAMSIVEIHGMELTDTLARFIGAKSMLLILDNCEHLLSACAELADQLLKACPSLAILSTSREPLGIGGERSWRVPSMTVPDERDVVGIEALGQYEAVQLFIERAGRSRQGFSVTNENAPALAQICFRLDGIPLAIELAAARVRVFTPQQISEGLTDRFHLLTAGAKTVMPRQQTLQASVDWSYFLLSGSERALLNRLSVFSGGFTFEAAEEVCSGEGIEKQQVLDLLSQLVDKSLVVMEEAAGASRYRLLETVRQYATDRLSESGQEDLLRARHRDYFAARSWSVVREIRSADERFLQYEFEQGNFRAALEYNAAKGEHNQLLTMILNGFGSFLTLSGQFAEWRSWIEKGLSAGESLPALRRAWAYFELGHMELNLGNLSAATSPIEESLVLFRELGSKEGETRALFQKMRLAIWLEDAKTFQSLSAQARELAQGLPSAWLDFWLGFFHLWRGNPFDGIPHYEDSAKKMRELGADTLLTWNPQIYKAVALLTHGEIVQARDILESAVAHGHQSPAASRLWVARPILDLALAYLFSGNYSEAIGLCEEALEFGVRTTTPPWTWVAYSYRSMTERATGNLEHAMSSAREALALTERIGSPVVAALSKFVLAQAIVTSGEEFHEARELLDNALPIAQEAGSKWTLQIGLPARSRLSRVQGDIAQAEDFAFEWLAHAQQAGSKLWAVDSLELVAGLAAERESFERAARIFGAAQRIRDEIGYPRFPIDREGYESDLGKVRSGLMDEFDQAWSEGANMSAEEAVGYAMRGRGERKRPSSGWAALTPTEVQIVSLVAEGLTNPQIGERLFVSKRTVQGHLGRIFAKLGISSRSELAAEAARRGGRTKLPR